MLKRYGKTLPALILGLHQLPAGAHVKWFLNKSEAQLLAMPRPQLFTQLSLGNGLTVVAFGLLLFLAHSLNRRFKNSKWNAQLVSAASRFDSHIQLAIGVSTGLVLIANAHNMTFFVPNLHLHSCCRWIAQTEAVIGMLLVLGLFTRPAALAMLSLLGYSFLKFPLNDCVDLVPMYGVAVYLLVAGRGRWAFDHTLGILSYSGTLACALGTVALRLAVGAGLVFLGFDEKLLHPQLALNLLQHYPSLNFLHFAALSDEWFVLLCGLTEVSLGICIAAGVLPRLCIAFLAAMFAITTAIFGGAELLGHLPYFAVFAGIFLRGAHFDFELLRAVCRRQLSRLQPSPVVV